MNRSTKHNPPPRRRTCWVLAGFLWFTSLTPAQPVAGPAIKKLGTLECDIVEATPVVFRERLYLFQSVRADYRHKAPGVDGPYFRFWDTACDEPTPSFARGYHLGSAHAEGATL